MLRALAVTGVVGLLVALWLPISGSASQMVHPAHGHPASPEITMLYGEHRGYSSSFDYLDLTFTDTHPPIESLTEEEKYIISGTDSSELPGNYGLTPWTIQIFSIVNELFTVTGSIPHQLTPELIRSIPGHENMSDVQLSEFLNPLTDQWPILDAASPSPGDIYIRRLTQDEINYYASLEVSLQCRWIDHDYLNAETGTKDPLELTSPIYYMRVYGWNGVLYNNFVYSWRWLSVGQ